MARLFIKAVVLSHSVELNADKILPLCQCWLHLLLHMEYSPDGSKQKPAKHCTLWATFYVFLSEYFAYTKHVPSWSWAGLSAQITALSCGRRCCVQANAPALRLAPASHLLFLAASELGGGGHWVSFQAPPVSPLSRLVTSVFHDLCDKFLSHEK